MICPKCGGNINEGDQFCQNCGAEIKKKKRTKKIRKKRILIAGILVVAVGAAAWTATSIFQPFNKKESAYVYFSDGQYHLLTSLDSDSSIDFASGTDGDYNKSDLVKFSPDGKYIYYYSQYNTESGTGTLCRAEWAKLSRNSRRNEKYIDIIDINVSPYFKFVKNNEIIYKNENNALYYYNGENSARIAKSVSSYYTDGDGRVIYTVDNDDNSDSSIGTCRLYGINVDAPQEKKKLVSDLSHFLSFDDFDNILYSKSTSDSSDLYVVGFDQEPKCIGKQASSIYCEDGEIYYTVLNGNTVSLYDYVEDPEKENTAVEGEPEEPRAVYEPLDWYCYEEDYDEIYTSCSQTCTFLENESQTSIEGQPEEEFRKFTEKYKSLENSQGYFLVTDVIKADLMELAELYGNGYEDEWLEFCFEKKTDIDSDYDDDEADDSEYIREQLKDIENNYPLRDLCHYKDGEVTTISKDVIAQKDYANCFSYATKDMITDRIKLEDVSECSDVESLFKVTLGEQSCLIPYDKDAPTIQFSNESGEYLKEIEENDWVNVYLIGNKVYILEDEGTLSMASVKDAVAGKFSKITNNASFCTGISDTTYYYKEEDPDTSVYDIYSCTDGKSTLKVKDTGHMILFQTYDDMILVGSGDSWSGYELSRISEDGNEVIIADDVSDFVRADKDNLLYISEGDLYVYDGKERKLLGMDADCFWTKDEVETTLQNGEWY